MTEIPQYIFSSATFIGTALAAFWANRSRVQSAAAHEQSTAAHEQSTATQKELEGPGDEPSLRKLIKDQGESLTTLGEKISKDFGALHVEVGGLSERIESLERAVFTTLEKRIVKVEDYVFAGGKHPRQQRAPRRK